MACACVCVCGWLVGWLCKWVNQRLAVHHFKCTMWRQRTARSKVHLKSFNARLAVDYPTYFTIFNYIKNISQLIYSIVYTVCILWWTSVLLIDWFMDCLSISPQFFIIILIVFIAEVAGAIVLLVFKPLVSLYTPYLNKLLCVWRAQGNTQTSSFVYFRLKTW